jgi:hypothetical protein
MGRTTATAERTGTTSGSQGTSMVEVPTLDIKNVRSILLGSSWQNVEDCEIVEGFALGVSHSPLGISQFFDKALKYKNQFGHECYAPLYGVLSWSTNEISQSQQQGTPYGDQQGSFARS